MASFNEFLFDNDFTGDDPGPDTDPTPDRIPEVGDSNAADGGNDTDVDNYEEPGEGDTFVGQDPTVFASEGNPEKPFATEGAVPPIEAEQQTATYNDPKLLGEQDDPESKEQIGDEQEGDEENDTADPANISPDVDAEDEVEYPEQGQDSDELTAKDPEKIEIPTYYDVNAFEPVEVGIGLEKRRELADITTQAETNLERSIREGVQGVLEEYERSRITLDDFREASVELSQRYLGVFNLSLEDFSGPRIDLDPESPDYIFGGETFGEMITEFFSPESPDYLLGASSVGSMFEDWVDVANGGEFGEVIIENLGVDDLFTSETSLPEFNDVIGGIDQDTYLTEFQWLNADDV